MSIPTLSQSKSSDWSQLPFLIRLMDDTSPVVRDKIARRLRDMGEEVWNRLEEAGIALTAAQRHALREILAVPVANTAVSNVLHDDWLDWLRLHGENEQLEAAFGWIARRNSGHGADEELRHHLDKLSRDFLRIGGAADPEELSTFLFDEMQIGLARGEEADPRHSDLLYILRGGQGLPISLTAIFILVGWRLDIAVSGCNFPGHFLARAPLWPGKASEEDLFFDTFNRGRVLRPDEVRALHKAAPQELSTLATAREIIARVLRNMANAYYLRHETEQTREVLALLHDLENAGPQL